jgi:hypothetical protein
MANASARVGCGFTYGLVRVNDSIARSVLTSVFGTNLSSSDMPTFRPSDEKRVYMIRWRAGTTGSLGLVVCKHGRHCLEYAVIPDQLMKENRRDMHQDECEEGKG